MQLELYREYIRYTKKVDKTQLHSHTEYQAMIPFLDSLSLKANSL